ncbi:MAG: T9SS type A sorting domain-containing protein, partial [Bacteroidota bacterium]
ETPDWAVAVAVSGMTAFVVTSDSGLSVVDVSDPANPYEVGFYDSLESPSDVAVSGCLLYVADGWSGGLRVLDVLNPAKPFEVGFHTTPRSASGVAVSGDYAFVADRDGGLKIFEYTVVAGVEEAATELPASYSLSQNYPNPFNPSTMIEFALPHAATVMLKVYNLLGAEVATLASGDHPAGTFKILWGASDIPSGVYFYRLSAGKFVQTRKMILMK